MLTFKVLSHMLLYPAPALRQGREEMAAIVEREALVNPSLRQGLCALLDRITSAEPFAAEAEYVRLFDSGRALSLHLFEHVHGDSRERGAAMVNLIEAYRARGLEISADELPDYLPLFLEFLSLQPIEDARVMLGEVADILALLQARLTQRESQYAVVFRALCAIGRAQVDIAALSSTVAAERPADIDKEWEDAPVRFDTPLPADAGVPCGAASAVVKRLEQQVERAKREVTP
jgi:nitrate reductase delta subunit